MSKTQLTIPEIGESINEAVIGRWHFDKGDWVEKGDIVLEIETDKANMEVNAPASGKLTPQAKQGTTVKVGQVIGHIDTEAEKPQGKKSTETPREEKEESTEEAKTSKLSSSAKPSAPPPPQEAPENWGPAKRKAYREGRTGPEKGEPLQEKRSDQTRVAVSSLRRRIAQRLVESQQQTATLTTFNEIDLSRVQELRSRYQEDFTERHGAKLGYMSFFTKAIAYAIKEIPIVNASLEEDEIVYHHPLHLGVAVSTERGLIVPVMPNAHNKSYAEIEKEVKDLAEKARNNQLDLRHLRGGTFTLTNGGVFGSLLSTPILNPPQSAILGMHKIEHRPVAVPAKNKGSYQVEVHPMMYVALSYDHRLIDGKDSVTFLVKVKEFLENLDGENIL